MNDGWSAVYVCTCVLYPNTSNEQKEGYWIFIYIILLIFFEAGKTSRGERCIEEKSWKSDYNV